MIGIIEAIPWIGVDIHTSFDRTFNLILSLILID
jgi:hypothetical protein